MFLTIKACQKQRVAHGLCVYAYLIENARRQAVERVGELLLRDAKCAQLRPNWGDDVE